MTIELQIISSERSDADLNAFTRDVQLELANTAGVQADLAEEPTAEGAKGLAAVVGGILLDVSQSSAISEVIKVFGAYLIRDRSMTIKVKAPDGYEIEVTGTNLRSDEIQAAIKTMVAEQVPV